MRVLNCFLDNRLGGPQVRARNVALKLQDENIDTVFLFNEKNKNYVPINDFKCFVMRYMQCITRDFTAINLFMFCIFLPRSIYKIYRIIKSEKIELLHINGITNCLPAFAGKIAGINILWHLNDTVTTGIMKKLFLPLAHALSDRIAIASEEVGRYYFSNNKRLWSRSVVLYAPVDTDKFNSDLMDERKKNSIKKELNIPREFRIIGATGNFTQAKGYEYFLKAASIIKKKEKNTKFIIIGSIKNKARYFQKIHKSINILGLENDIIILGFRNDVPELLSILDVFVLSSVSEACSIALLEALAMRVPVVATAVGGVREQIIAGENGIVVEPRKSDMLAQGILRILNTPKEDLKKMVNKGRERVKNIFSLDVIKEKYIHVYRSILRKTIEL
ncbi:MAG: glycosyltransferase family 4 protein [Candidatus Omnitrophica bacterium]|nr:glycosyltransferase family 4 protein [Candidatus Omnitrophota bacterium]